MLSSFPSHFQKSSDQIGIDYMQSKDCVVFVIHSPGEEREEMETLLQLNGCGLQMKRNLCGLAMDSLWNSSGRWIRGRRDG